MARVVLLIGAKPHQKAQQGFDAAPKEPNQMEAGE
jgi:hypothetical protein